MPGNLTPITGTIELDSSAFQTGIKSVERIVDQFIGSNDLATFSQKLSQEATNTSQALRLMVSQLEQAGTASANVDGGRKLAAMTFEVNKLVQEASRLNSAFSTLGNLPLQATDSQLSDLVDMLGEVQRRAISASLEMSTAFSSIPELASLNLPPINIEATVTPTISTQDMYAAGAKAGESMSSGIEDALDAVFEAIKSRGLTPADLKELNRKTPAERIREDPDTNVSAAWRFVPAGNKDGQPSTTLQVGEDEQPDWDKIFETHQARYKKLVTDFVDQAIAGGADPDLRSKIPSVTDAITEFVATQQGMWDEMERGATLPEGTTVLNPEGVQKRIDEMLQELIDQRLQSLETETSKPGQASRFFPTENLNWQANMPGVADIVEYARTNAGEAGTQLLKQMVATYTAALKEGIPAESEEMARRLTEGYSFGKKKGLSLAGAMESMEDSGVPFPQGQFPIAFSDLDKSLEVGQITVLIEKIKDQYLDVYRNSERWKEGQATIADVINDLAQSESRRDQFLLGEVQDKTAKGWMQGFGGQELASQVFNEPTMRSINASRQQQGQPGYSLLDMDKSVENFDALAASMLGVGEASGEAAEALDLQMRKEMSFTQIRNQAMMIRQTMGMANQMMPGVVPAPAYQAVGMLDNIGAVSPKLATSLLALTPAVIGATAAVGATIGAFKAMENTLQGFETQAYEMERLNKIFGDTKGLVSQIQTAFDGQLTEKQIQAGLSGVSKGSYLASNQDQLTTVAQISREQSQKLQQPFESFTPQVMQAIQTGNVAFLEQAGLLTNGAKALRDYADAQGTATGQLSAWQVQEALTAVFLSQNIGLLSEVTTSVEKYGESLDRLKTSGSEAMGRLNEAAAPFYEGWLNLGTGVLNGGIPELFGGIGEGVQTGDWSMFGVRNVFREAEGKEPFADKNALDMKMQAGMVRIYTDELTELDKKMAELVALQKQLGTPTGSWLTDPATRVRDAISDLESTRLLVLADLSDAQGKLSSQTVAKQQQQAPTPTAGITQTTTWGEDTTGWQDFSQGAAIEQAAGIDLVSAKLALLAKQQEITLLSSQRLFEVERIRAYGIEIDTLKERLAEAEAAPVTSPDEGNAKAQNIIAINALIEQKEALIRTVQSAVRDYDAQLKPAVEAETQLAQEAAEAAQALSNLGSAGAGSVSGLAAAQAQANALATTLDQLENSAISSGYAIATRLAPKFGMAGAMGYGEKFQQEANALQQAIIDTNEARLSSGQDLITEQQANMAFGMLTAGWQDDVSNLTKVGDSGVAQADRVKEAWEDAMESMIPAREDTTKGLLPIADDPNNDKQLEGILGAYDDVKQYGKDPKEVAREVSALMAGAGGGRKETMDENARRMADVVKLGTASPNYSLVEELIPEDIKEKGEQAIREYAAGLVIAHQEGMSNALMSVETATDQAIAKIKAKQTDESFKDQVLSNLQAKRDAGEFGVGMTDEQLLESMGLDSPEEKAAAAAQKMGMTLQDILGQLQINNDPATYLKADETAPNPLVEAAKVDATEVGVVKDEGTKLAVAFGGGMQSQLVIGNYGGAAVTEILNGIASKEAQVKESGATTGGWWGGAFSDYIKKNTPTELYNIMVPDLAKLIADAQAANGTGETGNGTTP